MYIVYSVYCNIVPEIHSLLFVGDNLPKFDDVLVFQLPQDLDLPDRGDGEALLLILQSDLLKSEELARLDVELGRWRGFINLAVSSLAHLPHTNHVKQKSKLDNDSHR